MKVMKLIAAVVLAGAVAHAADTKDAHKATTDTSHNPVTGSTTVTEKSKEEVKTADGESMSADVTKKTKTMKNGKKKVTKEIDAEAKTNH